MSASSRAEVTADLSRLVRARLRGLTPYWASEVPVDGCPGSPVVDFLAFVPAGRTDGGVERGEFHVFEVKSCMDDFTSGHGLSFVGDRNWLVCERVLAERLRDRMLVPQDCTVLVPDAVRRRLVTCFDTGGGPGRERSAALLLFQLLRRRCS